MRTATDDERCPDCGHHSDWGCAFECPTRKPPAHPSQYRAWADEQQRHYACGEVPGEKRERT